MTPKGCGRHCTPARGAGRAAAKRKQATRESEAVARGNGNAGSENADRNLKALCEGRGLFPGTPG